MAAHSTNTLQYPNKMSSSSLFSLTGYLQLQQKNFFKSGLRRYWFWFDEKTCSLKYYRSHETYTKGVHEPLGIIDLRYAKVTPGITSGSKSSSIFHISANAQVYILAASNADEALTWISNLQGKRGEYIKVSSVMEETALEQERDKRTLKSLNRPIGALAAPTDDVAAKSPPTVRKIIQSKISRGSMNLELMSTSPSVDPLRRSTIDPLMVGETASPTFQLTPTPEMEEPPIVVESCSVFSCGSLNPESRKIVELEASILNHQTDVNKLQREVLKLKERLDNRDEAILDLNKENFMLREEMAKMNKPHHELQSEISSLRDIIEQYKRSVRSLDDEVELHKLNQKEHQRRIKVEKQRTVELERELNTTKSKYITLLSTKFKVQIPNPSGGREDILEDVELARYTNELLALMEQEGGDSSSSFRGSFEDQYGDIHDWQTDVVTQRYLCRQLYLHYNQQELESHSHEWGEYLSQVKRTRKPYLDILTNGDKTKKELRVLLRRGVPVEYRVIVWTSLVYHQVGRMKETLDAANNGSYYLSLVHSPIRVRDAKLEKQIKIDLHRTLPNNRHFKLNGSGIPKLENILCAFSLHNKEVGYCQGMNMVAALGLIFLEEETVFWFMVAIIEKLLPAKYYTPDLAGVQADQLVLKELVKEKLPRLHTHLELFSIEMSFVTLNWFLTLFIDSMPTESALRIMDCFLLEGTKFLFRVSVSILKINQNLILKKNDLFVLLQFVKELAKHVFDIENLFQEFDKLAPFPTSATLINRHHTHLVIIQDTLNKTRKQKEERELERNQQRHQIQKLRASFIKEPNPVAKRRLVWECGCVCGREEVWLCGGDGKLGIVSIHDELTLLIPSIQVTSRIICAHYLPTHDIVIFGTLDFNLVAIDYFSRVEKWSHNLKDSILSITASQKGQVFAALADGFVAAIQAISVSSAPEPLLLKIGTTAVSSVILAGPEDRYLWCGCGKSIAVICTESLELVESLVLTDGSVSKLIGSDVGVWVSFRSSTLLALYDGQYFVPLVQLDYLDLLPPELGLSDKDNVKSNHRITSLMVVDGRMWVGTGGGRVIIFSCSPNVENTEEIILKLSKRKKASEKEATPTTGTSNSGGLLSQDVVVEERRRSFATVTDVRQVAIDNDSSVPSHYQKRRKTQFGKTLRNKSQKDKTREVLPDVYQLQFEHVSDVITANNESVRVLLPLSRCGREEFTVGCVNMIRSDWKKGVHVWKCPTDLPPDKWSFSFLEPTDTPDYL